MFFTSGNRQLRIGNSDTLDINNLESTLKIILKSEFSDGQINSENLEVSFDKNNWSNQLIFENKEPFENIDIWIRPESNDSNTGKIWVVNAS